MWWLIGVVRSWWRWVWGDYEPRHVLDGEAEYWAAEAEREWLPPTPQLEEHHDWPAFLPAAPPTEAEVAASRAAHGYIPELAALELAALDFGPVAVAYDFPQEPKAAASWGDSAGPGGESSLTPGPGPDWLADPLDTHHQDPPSHNIVCANEPDLCPWPGSRSPERERLADTGDIRDAALLAEVTAYMAGQDAEVADWLAARAVEWARLEIGALA